MISAFTYLTKISCCNSKGAEVGRFERSVFVFLALFRQAFCFCFLGQ